MCATLHLSFGVSRHGLRTQPQLNILASLRSQHIKGCDGLHYMDCCRFINKYTCSTRLRPIVFADSHRLSQSLTMLSANSFAECLSCPCSPRP